jgi:hypothetical protein
MLIRSTIFDEFMMYFSVHQELSEKQKPPTHQGSGFANPPAEILFGEFPHRTSSETSVPQKFVS